MSKTKFAWGNGQPGCMFDHVAGPFDTKAEAVESANELHELSAEDQACLMACGLLYQQHTETDLCTGLIEMFEVDENWSCE